MRVPLAWRNLTGDPPRMLMSLLGIGFSVLLMLMQLGFRNSLVDSQVQLVHALNCDAIILSRSKYQLNKLQPFSRRRLHQAVGVEGVVAAEPVYMALPEAMWKNPFDRTRHRIRVVGIDPLASVFRPGNLAALQPRLVTPDTVLLDSRCRGCIGHVAEGDSTELSGRRVKVVGGFALGTDFQIDGTAVTSSRTFFNLFPEYRAADPKLNRVELGLVTCSPGSDVEAVVGRLNAALPPDVVTMSRLSLVRLERDFWMANSPVGLVFNLGTVVGFIVGVVICAQILFTEVSEKRPQFATLKAIGYSNGYLTRVVLTQAGLLAVFGFVPGLVASWLIYQGVAGLTGLLMRLSTELSVTVLALTVTMCLVSGLSAVRTVLKMDPADVF